MIFREATINDIPVIHGLAHRIWWPAYGQILSRGQIELMLEKMYSEESLNQQFEAGIKFFIADEEKTALGFASMSPAEREHWVFKIHKLYILPSEQGKGTGKKFVNHLAAVAKQEGGKILELNVNRNNPALYFYQKLGFKIHKEVDTPYYQFTLNDYILRLSL